MRIYNGQGNWWHRWKRLVALAVLVGLSTGCATLFGSGDEHNDNKEEEVSEMELDPVLIRADDDGESEHLEADEVFEKAYYAFQENDYEEAAQYYQLVVDYFDDSRFYLPSLYNSGLSYEALDNWERAVESFELLLRDFPDSEQALNAEFRLANALYELGEYEGVDDRLTELLLDADLEHYDRVEAHVRRGNALLELEEWTDAENSFRNALDSNEDARPSERLADDELYIIQAHYGRGKVYHGRMNEIPLVLPPEQMEVDLEEKAEYHQSALASYLRAVEEHHPRWSVAAGYELGRLFQDMYIDILTAEIPDDLSDEELVYYFDELRNKLEVLVDRATNIYERNLSFARRIAAYDDRADRWVDKTTRNLERAQALRDDAVVQQRAEELILEQGHLEGLWEPGYYARHAVDGAVDEAVEEVRDLAPDEVAAVP